VLAALGAYVERFLELLANVDVPAGVALLPGVGRNFQPFTLRCPWLAFFLKPCHHGHREAGRERKGAVTEKAPAISTDPDVCARP
jgi:hypothetical protein